MVFEVVEVLFERRDEEKLAAEAREAMDAEIAARYDPAATPVLPFRRFEPLDRRSMRPRRGGAA